MRHSSAPALQRRRRILDEVTLAVDKLPAPAAGTQYEAWLLGQGGERGKAWRC